MTLVQRIQHTIDIQQREVDRLKIIVQSDLAAATAQLHQLTQLRDSITPEMERVFVAIDRFKIQG